MEKSTEWFKQPSRKLKTLKLNFVQNTERKRKTKTKTREKMAKKRRQKTKPPRIKKTPKIANSKI